MLHGYVLTWSTVTTAGSMVGLLYAGFKFFYKVRTWFEQTNGSLGSQSKHLTAQDARLDKIEHELQPNSGSSHHDQVLTAVQDLADIVGELADRLDGNPRPRRPRHRA